MLTASSAVMLPLALTFEGLPSLHYLPQAWAALGYLALLSSAFAYILFYRVLHAAGAGNLSLVTLLVAPVAVVLGAVIYDEALPASGLFRACPAGPGHAGHRWPAPASISPRENPPDLP